ncbi:hypothetical protein L7F22_030638 [Adiantum nelumboides]|nr:hypothetical protein [Adiantum nelumboides]
MPHPKLYQIARLREMLKWCRRKALRKAHSFSDVRSARRGRVHTRRSLSMPTERSAKGAGVPPGHLAVYVGEERKRFVIKTSYLSHPLFRALLKKIEEEMGFHQEGALTIPCQVPFFEHVLQFIHSSKSRSNHSAHHHNFMILHHHHHLPCEDPTLPPQFRELLRFSSLDSCSSLSMSPTPYVTLRALSLPSKCQMPMEPHMQC